MTICPNCNQYLPDYTFPMVFHQCPKPTVTTNVPIIYKQIEDFNKLKLCEDEYCKQTRVDGFSHYIKNPIYMYYEKN